jgi:hypothetical protein
LVIEISSRKQVFRESAFHLRKDFGKLTGSAFAANALA